MSQEALRKLNDLAIACGRQRLNAQTGFVHHFYHPEGDEAPVTIPTLENVLYALALFKSRTAENIHEAKDLLERLLPFQCAGNFPIYLHEYPLCRDRYHGFHLLPPLYWITSQFQHILGQELKTRLDGVTRALVDYSLQMQEEKPAPGYIAIKCYAAAAAFGKLWLQNALRLKGEEGLKTLDRSLWHSPAYLGEILSAIQMTDLPFPDLWQHLANTWDRTTCTYIGPALREYQAGLEPQPTLYDLYLGYFTDHFSTRALKDGIHLLHGALIQPSTIELPEPQTVAGIYRQPNVAYALTERKPGWNVATDKSFHPLRMVWGGTKRLHTFVCQGGNSLTCVPQAKEDSIELLFDLADPIEVEDREKSREIAFYLDLADTHRLNVSGTPATTFLIQDEIAISSTCGVLTLQFHVVEGEAQFMGHIMKGNRPAQNLLKGENRYNAYDWQIFLRTIRRSHPCKIRATIRLMGEQHVIS